ncbi:MAG: hypothetical protein KBG02_03035, partial [Haliscomenobacter sp.]|nr:hypothetical protein [Haliscomenobacter sp.]
LDASPLPGSYPPEADVGSSPAAATKKSLKHARYASGFFVVLCCLFSYNGWESPPFIFASG